MATHPSLVTTRDNMYTRVCQLNIASPAWHACRRPVQGGVLRGVAVKVAPLLLLLVVPAGGHAAVWPPARRLERVAGALAPGVWVRSAAIGLVGPGVMLVGLVPGRRRPIVGHARDVGQAVVGDVRGGVVGVAVGRDVRGYARDARVRGLLARGAHAARRRPGRGRRGVVARRRPRGRWAGRVCGLRHGLRVRRRRRGRASDLGRRGWL